MSVNTSPQIPDYDLDDMVVVTTPVQLRALSDDQRGSLLELVLERAATVTELAQAVGRPKSTTRSISSAVNRFFQLSTLARLSSLMA